MTNAASRQLSKLKKESPSKNIQTKVNKHIPWNSYTMWDFSWKPMVP